MVQDSDIVATEDWKPVVCGSSNGTIISDLEWSWRSLLLLLKVTGSDIHCKWGNMSEMVHNGVVVTTDD